MCDVLVEVYGLPLALGNGDSDSCSGLMLVMLPLLIYVWAVLLT